MVPASFSAATGRSEEMRQISARNVLKFKVAKSIKEKAVSFPAAAKKKKGDEEE